MNTVPSTLQLNVECLNANGICVVRHLANKNNALVIIFQETHCTNADQLVIPNHTLVDWFQARNTALIHLPMKDSNGPLLINLLKDRKLNGFVWMLMAAKLSISTNHPTRN